MCDSAVYYTNRKNGPTFLFMTAGSNKSPLNSGTVLSHAFALPVLNISLLHLAALWLDIFTFLLSFLAEEVLDYTFELTVNIVCAV